MSHWLNRREHWKYWEGYVSRRDFEEFKQDIIRQINLQQKANRQAEALFREIDEFKKAQGQVNKILLDRTSSRDLYEDNEEEDRAFG